MIKKILLTGGLIVITAFTYIYFINDINEYLLLRHSIKWSENVKINFSDYELKPKVNNQYNVHMFYGIFLKANSVKDAYTFSYFDKAKSSIVDSTRIDKNFLNSQKSRFDLYEKYSKLINQDLNKIRNDDKKRFKDLKEIYFKRITALKLDEAKKFKDSIKYDKI